MFRFFGRCCFGIGFCISRLSPIPSQLFFPRARSFLVENFCRTFVRNEHYCTLELLGPRRSIQLWLFLYLSVFMPIWPSFSGSIEAPPLKCYWIEVAQILVVRESCVLNFKLVGCQHARFCKFIVQSQQICLSFLKYTKS